MFHVCILSPCILYPAVLDIKISTCEVSRFWTCQPIEDIKHFIPVFEEIEGVAEEEEEDADDNDWFIQADDVY